MGEALQTASGVTSTSPKITAPKDHPRVLAPRKQSSRSCSRHGGWAVGGAVRLGRPRALGHLTLQDLPAWNPQAPCPGLREGPTGRLRREGFLHEQSSPPSGRPSRGLLLDPSPEQSGLGHCGHLWPCWGIGEHRHPLPGRAGRPADLQLPGHAARGLCCVPGRDWPLGASGSLWLAEP